MKDKTSSKISTWFTDDLIKERINNQKLHTASQEIESGSDHIIVPEIKNKTKVQAVDKVETTGEPSRVIEQPVVCFSNSSSPDWDYFKKALFSSLSWDSLQVGEPVEVEFLIKDLIEDTSKEDVISWIYDLYLNNCSNALLLCTLMHALSHLDYETVYPFGPMMAMVSLSHKDKRVVSFAIKAFSNWNSKDSLNYINDFEPQQEWAQQEWASVRSYIEENGDELNGIFNAENQPGAMDTRSA